MFSLQPRAATLVLWPCLAILPYYRRVPQRLLGRGMRPGWLLALVSRPMGARGLDLAGGAPWQWQRLEPARLLACLH